MLQLKMAITPAFLPNLVAEVRCNGLLIIMAKVKASPAIVLVMYIWQVIQISQIMSPLSVVIRIH